MFINSQVGLLSLQKLGKFSGTSCRSEPSVGISGWDHSVNRRGFSGLIGAAVSALSERHLAGVKTSLVIAAIGGLAWLIATAFFAAGGAATNITLQAVN
jgi:hypothetical protein